jgi:hypothetical protein
MNRTSGSLMMAFGILIAGGSALLSLIVAGLGLSYDGLTSDMIKEGALSLALFGGLPFLFGLGLVFIGRRAVRNAKDDVVEVGDAARFGLPLDQDKSNR